MKMPRASRPPRLTGRLGVTEMNLPSDATVSDVNLLITTILLALAIPSKYIVEVSRDQLSRLGPGS